MAIKMGVNTSTSFMGTAHGIPGFNLDVRDTPSTSEKIITNVNNKRRSIYYLVAEKSPNSKVHYSLIFSTDLVKSLDGDDNRISKVVFDRYLNEICHFGNIEDVNWIRDTSLKELYFSKNEYKDKKVEIINN